MSRLLFDSRSNGRIDNARNNIGRDKTVDILSSKGILSFFFICDARICIAAHRTIEKRDVRSSAVRKIAGFIDRIVARKICIRARCGQTVVNAPILGMCTYMCLHIECVLHY